MMECGILSRGFMMQNKELLNLADMIQGEINRMCVTDDINELYNMAMYARKNINKLCAMRDVDLKMVPEEQPKKKLTFSERQKIVREYHDWRLFNNAADCAESFLAYLCIKGFIDG